MLCCAALAAPAQAGAASGADLSPAALFPGTTLQLKHGSTPTILGRVVLSGRIEVPWINQVVTVTLRRDGRVVAARTVPVNPDNGRFHTRIRLKGKGEAGAGGGPSGDLFVVVQVDASALYERRGADLVLDVPVTYPEAALGATVQIPTPEGPVALKVPAGSETGKLLRVKGRGAPKLQGGGRGDLLARVKVTVPHRLSKVEREALESYQKVLKEQPREKAFS